MKSPGHWIKLSLLAIVVIELARSPAAAGTPGDSLPISALLDSASALVRVGQSDAAFEILCAALPQAEDSYGERDTVVADVCHWMGTIHMIRAEYQEAEDQYSRALAIRRTVLGDSSLTVAQSLNSLGAVYWRLGRYGDAEAPYNEALAIKRSILGEDHPEVATQLNNLGVLYRALGRNAEADRDWRIAARIIENHYGTLDIDLAPILCNQGDLYLDEGRLDSARSAYRRTLVILDSIPEEYPGLTVKCLTSLGDISLRQNRVGDAAGLLNRAARISQNIFGDDHPNTGEVVRGLAHLALRTGDIMAADSLAHRALAISTGAFGDTHPEIAHDLLTLSRVLRIQGHPIEALRDSHRAVEIMRNSFLENANVLSERDALLFSRFVRETVDNYLSILMEIPEPTETVVREAADLIVTSKGLVTDVLLRRRAALDRHSVESSDSLSEELRHARFELSRLFISGEGPSGGSRLQRLDSLTKHVASLETAQLRLSGEAHSDSISKPIVALDVMGLLTPDAACVEFVKYRYRDAGGVAGRDRYLAVVLTRHRVPAVVDLGEGKFLDAAVAAYRHHLLVVAQKETPPSREDVDSYRRVGTSLRLLVFGPTEHFLHGVDQLILAPDGALNLVAFEALPDTAGRYLGERFAMHCVSAARDLLRQRNTVPSGRGLFALGDPDFDAEPDRHQTTATDAGRVNSAYTADRWRSWDDCDKFLKTTVAPLPGTRREILGIGETWERLTGEPAHLYLGTSASEWNIKKHIGGVRVVHLATHGYYLEARCLTSVRSNVTGGVTLHPESVNPLLLSGLLVSGANVTMRDPEIPTAEDGVLTAYEVAALNLSGTEVVVLSACETGLGKVWTGEGVFGLRRAFQMAGARTVICSLWKISDRQTVKFMHDLYGSQSTTFAQLMQELSLRRLKELRLRGRPDHPCSWAGFVAIGDINRTP